MPVEATPTCERVIRLTTIPANILEDCWLFNGAKLFHGYGGIQGGRTIGTLRAHVVMYEAYYGKVPDGLEVCHTCHVRNCVNPRHLYVDTHAHNMLACSFAGRGSGGQPPGENHPKAKLLNDQMAEIQKEYAAGGTTYQALADKYGCSKKTVMNIVKGLCRIGNTVE